MTWNWKMIVAVVAISFVVLMIAQWLLWAV